MPGLNYSSFVSSVANLLVVPVSDVNFQIALPNIIDDAELRIYRDLDLLDTQTTTTGTLTTGTRLFDLPTPPGGNGPFVVIDNINVITPAGTTNPESGTRVALWPISLDSITMLYPSSSGSTAPQYFAMVDQNRIALGPWPASAYTVEVTGTIRPLALSSSNVTTVLSTYFPDLMVAAAMVFGAGYQKNFGAAVDDPKAAVTWETHYQSLLAGASIEENRKRFTAAGWSSDSPAPQATPPRT